MLVAPLQSFFDGEGGGVGAGLEGLEEVFELAFSGGDEGEDGLDSGVEVGGVGEETFGIEFGATGGR